MALALLKPETEAIIIKLIADDLELDMIWNAFAKTTLQQERRFKPVLRRLFSDQEAEVLRKISQNPPPEPEERGMKVLTGPIIDPWLINPTEWEVVFENAGKPFIQESMREGYEDGVKRLENALDTTFLLSFDVHDPNVEKMFLEKIQKFSFEVNDTTNKMLKKEFGEAIREGENIRMISARASKVFGLARDYRTERIARTEIIGSYNAGNYRTLLDSGVVETKRWIATRDARTRDSHVAIDGEVVKVDKKFSNGLRFPGDWNGAASEIINCRCTFIAEDFVAEGE